MAMRRVAVFLVVVCVAAGTPTWLGSGWLRVSPVQAASADDVGYSSLVPARLLDTRPGSPTVDGGFAGGGPVGPHATLNLTVVGRGGVPASGVGAVVLNITA